MESSSSLSNSSKLNSADVLEDNSSNSMQDASKKEIKLENEKATTRLTKTPTKLTNNENSQNDQIKKESNSDGRSSFDLTKNEEIKIDNKQTSSDTNNISTLSNTINSNLSTPNSITTSSTLTSSSDPLISSNLTTSTVTGQQQSISTSALPNPFLPPTVGLGQVPLFDPLFVSNSKCSFFHTF